MRRTLSPLAILAMMMGAVWSGCDTEPQALFPNVEPNTRISAAPPERADASYSVHIYWFGWDEDGFVSHYEIAWETTDQWLGPIFATDSLFTVAASDTCCVPPLPEHGATPPDSIYEQFHTFYVRAVDNKGVPDPDPAHRSFNAKTIAPYTEIDFGPVTPQEWSPNIKLKWLGKDDDGEVEQYRYAVSSVKEFIWDRGQDGKFIDYIAWIDTLSYRPLGPQPGDRGPSPWLTTMVDSVEFLIPEETTEDKHVIFAVRAIDNAGAEERRLDRCDVHSNGDDQRDVGEGNVSVFKVKNAAAGPRISLTSNVAGSKRSGEAADVREVFAGDGIRFTWSAQPGENGVAVAGYSRAIDDTSQWTPFSPNDTEYPPSIDGVEQFWFPSIRDHAFFVRAIDFAGFIRVLVMNLEIFGGPTFCEADDRYVVVVLDTDADQYIETQVLPTSYEESERGLIDYLFDGYDYILYQTQGEEKPDLSLLNCASSVFWFTTSDIVSGDASSLFSYHVDPPNALSSYVSARGNLFLCGMQLTNNTKYFDDPESPIPVTQTYPVIFSNTLDDTTWVPHWCAAVLKIDRVAESVPSTYGASGELATKRLRKAVSQVQGFPDLDFDPLTWPNGPVERGCGLYDRGMVPLAGAQVLYRANDDAGPPIAIRKHVGGGVNGNVVVLGFHPYFFQRPQARELIRAVLDDFGEVPTS
jgi:hypothetical protein